MVQEQPSDRNGRESSEPKHSMSDKTRNVDVCGNLQNQGGIVSNWQLGQCLNEGNYTIELDKNKSKYLLEKTLGSGGFGITYLAKDKNGKQVVIKTLNKNVQGDSNFNKFKEDFYSEALALAKCNHPHIVPIIKIIHEQGLPCIVMEYINGKNLDKLVREQGILLQIDAISYIQQIGEALKVVHNQRLLHRDVKPQNIIIRADGGGAVLIDFGIARHFRPSEEGPLTSFKSVGYAPIEQYDPNGQHGFHSDVYALAATLYFMLTKTTPEDAEIRIKTKEDSLKLPKELNSDISEQVNQAIIKGMERYLEDRPQSIQEWLNLLETNEGEIVNHPNIPPDEDPPIDTNYLALLLARAAFMGIAIWLFANSLVKLIGNFETTSGINLLFCVGLIFLAQYRLPRNEPKSYLFISGVIPTLLILPAVVLQKFPGRVLIALTGLPGMIVVGIFALSVMAILKFVTESDDEP